MFFYSEPEVQTEFLLETESGIQMITESGFIITIENQPTELQNLSYFLMAESDFSLSTENNEMFLLE